MSTQVLSYRPHHRRFANAIVMTPPMRRLARSGLKIFSTVWGKNKSEIKAVDPH